MKIKKIIVGLFTMLCIICAFAFTACGNNTGKDDPKATYYTVTFYANINGDDADVIPKRVESGRTAADKVPTNMINGGYLIWNVCISFLILSFLFFWGYSLKITCLHIWTKKEKTLQLKRTSKKSPEKQKK